MPRYIDADEVLETMQYGYAGVIFAYTFYRFVIDEMPTAYDAPCCQWCGARMDGDEQE